MPIRKSSISGGSTPSGTTEDRPANPSIGDTFFNGTLGVQEIYTSSGWLPATGANDFNIVLTGSETSVTLDKEYFSGAYTISSALSDTIFDVYLYNTSNQPAGYTSSPSINATDNFNRIVVYGGTNGDLLSFSYKTTFTTSTSNNDIFAPAFAISATPTALSNIDDTTVIAGGNFDTDVQVYFIGSDNVERESKNVLRNSSTELVVTRPDNFPTNIGSYTIKVANPETTLPLSTSKHLLQNAISAGTTPNWTTSAYLPEVGISVPYSTTLVATDVENTDIDYSIISGSLPSGLSLDGETGIISGTVLASFSTLNFTVRAIDTGGNTVDRQFYISEADNPVWNTSSDIYILTSSSSISYQLNASDNSPITYSIQSGSLPAGYSLSNSGLISGTYSNPEIFSVTIRAEDTSGSFTDKSFTINVSGDGSSSSFPAGSALSLQNAGVTTSGLYWLNLGNGQGAQQVYCLLDPSVDGGGWMVIYGTPAGATSYSYRFSSERQDISGIPIETNYSLDSARRSGVTAISDQNQSLVYRNNTGWMRLSGTIWNSTTESNGANFRFEFNTSILTSDGTTDTTAEVGATDFGINSGGDFGIAINENGLDHHNSTDFYNLNSSCANMYLYNYGAGYRVNTGLSGWSSATTSCTNNNNNDIGFLVAMR